MRDHEKAAGSPGRPREFDETEVLAKIMSLFWEKGYEGTGLSDIMNATGLQKGSLYKAFDSKQDMYVRALAHYEHLNVDAAVHALNSGGEPIERIRAFLSAPMEAAWDRNDWRGCFLCNASADHAVQDSETQALVVRGYGKLEAALKVAIGDARTDWPDATIASMAQLLLAVYSGLRVMARARVERDRLEGAKEAGLALLAQ